MYVRTSLQSQFEPSQQFFFQADFFFKLTSKKSKKCLRHQQQSAPAGQKLSRRLRKFPSQTVTKPFTTSNCQTFIKGHQGRQSQSGRKAMPGPDTDADELLSSGHRDYVAHEFSGSLDKHFSRTSRKVEANRKRDGAAVDDKELIKRSAVLLPLCRVGDQVGILFTKRSGALR